MRDPYEILGVSKGATAAEIKSAYRRLAKKHHPDANKHDTKAASRFAELNAAYEIVGDDDKRKAFDRGEIDGEGKPRFQGFAGAQPGGGFGQGASHFENFSFGADGFQRRAGAGASGGGGFEDMLRGMFGNATRGRGGAEFEPENFGAPTGGQDVHASVTITLVDAAKGSKIARPSRECRQVGGCIAPARCGRRCHAGSRVTWARLRATGCHASRAPPAAAPAAGRRRRGHVPVPC